MLALQEHILNEEIQRKIKTLRLIEAYQLWWYGTMG